MLEALKGPNQKTVSAMIVEFEPGLLAPEVPIRELLSKVFDHAINAVLVEHWGSAHEEAKVLRSGCRDDGQDHNG